MLISLDLDTAGADPCSDPDKSLLTIEEARALALSFCRSVTETETVGLREAPGRVLTEPVSSVHPLPPFDHSAVDGYGLALGEGEHSAYTVVGRVPAGQTFKSKLRPGEAVRIFTGAPVPAGCDAVVMQEKAEARNGRVQPHTRVAVGDNIRRAGEDVGALEPLVRTRTRLDARHIALLAAGGIPAVRVSRPVRVALISTGDELREPGERLEHGAICDSNRMMLSSLLARPDIECFDLGIVPDTPEAITAALRQASKEADLILTSGGVSVGEEDHVRDAVAAAGGVLQPLRIAMKPGKPLALGRIGSSIILGLPGNPLAALAGFLLIGRDVLARLSGANDLSLTMLSARAAFSRARKPGRTELAPARIVGQSPEGLPLVEALGKGGSARLRPLTVADGFCAISAECAEIRQGDAVRFIPFAGLI